jgi:hypothetical protein
VGKYAGSEELRPPSTGETRKLLRLVALRKNGAMLFLTSF